MKNIFCVDSPEGWFEFDTKEEAQAFIAGLGPDCEDLPIILGLKNGRYACPFPSPFFK